MKHGVKKSVLLIIFLFNFIPCIFALPSPSKQFYVNDFADVLSDETENYLFANSKLLDDKTTAQVVIATVQSLEDKGIDDFSLELFREWKIGNADKNNGILITLAINERKIKVSTGYGLEGAVNDSKAGRFIDIYAAPHLKENNFNDGIKELYSAIIAEVYNEYNIPVPEDVSGSFSEKEFHRGENTVYSGAITTTLTLIFLWMLLGRRRNRRGGPPPFIGGGFYGGPGMFGGGSGGGFGGGGGSTGGGGASRGF